MTREKPAGKPDTARPASRGAGQVAGEWLSRAEAAELASMEPDSWSSLVSTGHAPKPDDPGDVSMPPPQRHPRWLRRTVLLYAVKRTRSRRGVSAAPCSQCKPGHDRGDGRCGRHGRVIVKAEQEGSA